MVRVAGIALLVGFMVSSVQAAGADTFEQRLAGSWTTEHAPQRLLTRVVIVSHNGRWWLRTFAVRGLQEEKVSEAELHLLRNGIGATAPLERGLAVWSDGDATFYATTRLGKAGLLLDLTKVYRDAKTANWFLNVEMVRAK